MSRVDESHRKAGRLRIGRRRTRFANAFSMTTTTVPTDTSWYDLRLTSALARVLVGIKGPGTFDATTLAALRGRMLSQLVAEWQ